ncbi:MAG: hypothetical protein EPO16_13215 [Dehalococcoidia bacterium]|nr:MAG: hypothetical protein EPO16_13215 [Dehalococcoidia bacterium]
MFNRLLTRAVDAGKITQARADELKAQFAQGGDSAKAAMRVLHEAVGGLDLPPHRRGGPVGRLLGRGPSS